MLYLYKSRSCSFFLCYLKIFAYVLNTSACAPKHKVIIHNTLNIGWKFNIGIIISPMTQFSLYLDSSDFPQNIIDFFLIQYFNKDPKWHLIVTPNIFTLSLTTTDLFSSTIVWQINWISIYILLWLASLSVMSLRFIQVVLCISLFLYTGE